MSEMDKDKTINRRCLISSEQHEIWDIVLLLSGGITRYQDEDVILAPNLCYNSMWLPFLSERGLLVLSFPVSSEPSDEIIGTVNTRLC